MEEAAGLVFQPVSAEDGGTRQVVLELPEGVDTSEGVIMQIDGDKIHIITQGGTQLSSTPLGLSMDSLIQDGDGAQLQMTSDAGDGALHLEEAAGDEQLQLEEAGGQLQLGDGEEQPEGVEKAGGCEEVAHVEEAFPCFVCAEVCLRPCRLLFSRAASSGVSLAERLGGLLPLRLRVSADDSCCDRCRQLLEQADQLHTELKTVELQVRQLFRLEEKLEEEEERQEREEEARQAREQELNRRREQAQAREEYLEQERRQEQEQRAEAARRTEEALSRLRPDPPHIEIIAQHGNAEPLASAQRSHRNEDPEWTPASRQDLAAARDFLASSGRSEVDLSGAPAPQPVVIIEGPAPEADGLKTADGRSRSEETFGQEEAPASSKRCTARRPCPRRPWSPSDAAVPRRAADARSGPPEPPALAPSDPPPGQGTAVLDVEQAADKEQEHGDTGQEVAKREETAAAAFGQEPTQDTTKPSEQEPESADLLEREGVNTTNIEFLSMDGPGAAGEGSLGQYGLTPGRRSGGKVTPSFFCRRCNTQFNSGNEVVAHVRSVHSQAWCRRCRAEFPDRPSLLKHRRRCQALCTCEECGEQVLDLELHMKEVHPRRHPRGTRRPSVKSRRGSLRQSSVEEAAQPPRVIEFHDVSTLREQVKDVKTPRNALKFRKLTASDITKIQHLNVNDEPLEGLVDSKPNYLCLRCGETFVCLKDQVQHLHTVHKGKSWCRRCKSEFDSKTALLEHRAFCKTLNEQGICGTCGKHVKHLKMHMKRHENPGKRKRERVMGEDGKMVNASLAGGDCSVCKKYISQRLKRHVASHVQHPCPICKKLFSREDVIAGHIKRVHMKERPYICNSCGKGFVSLYSLQRHEMIHTETYKFYCQECGDGFRQKQQLTAHMRHKHGVVEIEFEDVTETTLLGDLSEHADLRFLCQECGSGFPSRRTLTEHMREKHGVANVVFEDVHLHVADNMGQLQEVSVVQEIADEVDPDTGGRPLTEQEETAAASETQWWGDQGAPY